MCSKPYRQGVAEYGCGQCMPCRINRRRLWTGRLLLESGLHEQSLFVTLTYGDEALPEGGSLRKRDVQLFLKRLRRLCAEKIRFYAVGEYGSKRGRPHYHLVLFGISGCFGIGKHVKCDCVICRAWPWGLVHVGIVEPASAAYVAKYTLKGMTNAGDSRLLGLEPEFCRMSLRPGIGAGAMKEVSRVGVVSKAGCVALARDGDVPEVFRAYQRKWVFGRYLRRVLREESGLSADLGRASADARNAALAAALRVEEGRRLLEAKRTVCARKGAFLSGFLRGKGQL